MLTFYFFSFSQHRSCCINHAHFLLFKCIQPVELLHKPLLEFEEELLPDGASIRTIYELYDAHETGRQSKYFNPYSAEILV